MQHDDYGYYEVHPCKTPLAMDKIPIKTSKLQDQEIQNTKIGNMGLV